MIQIDDKIISLDILEKKFHCDLSKCLGLCCVLGHSGAPLEQQEAADIEANLKGIEPFMGAAGVEAVRQQGVSVIDDDNELVTPLVNGDAECAFVVYKDDIALCAIEMAFIEGVISVQKPISCHLYPIRVKKYPTFTALNYDHWDICAPARGKGEKEGVPVYKFLEKPITRAYGKEFYNALEHAASQLEVIKSKV